MWSREDRRTLVLLLPLLVLAVAAFLLLEPKTPRAAPPDAAKEAPPELFEFDPNTVDYRALRRLGFTKQDAAGVLRYPGCGKDFPYTGGFRRLLSGERFDVRPSGTLSASGRSIVSGPAATSAQRLRKPFVPASGSSCRSCPSASTR